MGWGGIVCGDGGMWGNVIGLAVLSHLWRRGWGSSSEDEAKHRDEEGGSFARACLGTGHEVPPGYNNGQRILLHGSRAAVLGQL